LHPITRRYSPDSQRFYQRYRYFISLDAKFVEGLASKTIEAFNSEIGIIDPLELLGASGEGRCKTEQNLDDVNSKYAEAGKREEDCLSKMQDGLV
jgi:hypothetical protein